MGRRYGQNVGPDWDTSDMSGSSRLNQAALSATLLQQDRVISRPQALACGMTRAALAHRARPDGPWQRLIQGVYLAHTGIPTAPQKEMAALLHAGDGSVLTGRAALYGLGLGLATAEPRRFDVLVPATRRPSSVAFIRIRRTTRMPERIIREGRRSYVLPPRALADAARFTTDLGEVRALIAGAVQRGDCPLGALARELDQGPARNAARLRQVLAEAADGVRSVTEAEFRHLIKRARLPTPIFNARLFAADGTFIAVPDAWWPAAGVAAEVDSREWHLSPADWERTLRRHAEMSRRGIFVLHFTPGRIRSHPAAVVAAITDTLRAGHARPALPITVRPAA
jgi:hypothetical protein